ncbi:MAG: hypothetical protein SH809_13405 [Rhodothermales bacterium]|nr:hypothetical protein [Rhodothermales bacterium]
MSRKEWAAGLFLALTVVSSAAAFLAGPLVPWAPFRIGYTEYRSVKAVLIMPSTTLPPVPLDRLDALIGEVEAQTGLWLESPVRIVVAGSWGLFNRGALLGLSSSVGEHTGRTLPTGTVVYLSPLASQPGQEAANALKHEITHAVLFQQMSLARSMAFAKLEWLSEGLAAYIATGSLGGWEVEWSRMAIAEAYLYPVTRDAGFEAITEADRSRFVRETRRQFVRYLMTRYGADAFYLFLDRVLAEPDQQAAAFRDTFGVTPDEADAAFMREVEAGTWPFQALAFPAPAFPAPAGFLP